MGLDLSYGPAADYMVIRNPDLLRDAPPLACVFSNASLELPSIGWQLFILDSSQSDSTAFPSFLNTCATRLLAEPLRRLMLIPEHKKKSRHLSDPPSFSPGIGLSPNPRSGSFELLQQRRIGVVEEEPFDEGLSVPHPDLVERATEMLLDGVFGDVKRGGICAVEKPLMTRPTTARSRALSP